MPPWKNINARRNAVAIIKYFFCFTVPTYALYQQYQTQGMYIAERIFGWPSTISRRLTDPNAMGRDAIRAPTGPMPILRAKWSIPSAPIATEVYMDSTKPAGVPNAISKRNRGENTGNSGSPKADVPPHTYGFQSGN